MVDTSGETVTTRTVDVEGGVIESTIPMWTATALANSTGWKKAL